MTPSEKYPWHWSIYRWIKGESANTVHLDERQLIHIAIHLGQFLNELHAIDYAEGPEPGPYNFYRGGVLSLYDNETREALIQLQDYIDVQIAQELWEKALSSQWNRDPVWVHGDLYPSNILVKNGRLAGVIDFGCMGIGDPACDLVIAWTLFNNENRRIFKEQVGLDENTWLRARGWVLWKALVELAQGGG